MLSGVGVGGGASGGVGGSVGGIGGDVMEGSVPVWRGRLEVRCEDEGVLR